MTHAYERHGAGRVLSADETAERRKQVRGFWHHCDHAPGTPAARYLARRGLPWLAMHEHVRYRADTSHPSGARLPAMVWLVTGPEGTSLPSTAPTWTRPAPRPRLIPSRRRWAASRAAPSACIPPRPRWWSPKGWKPRQPRR